MRASRRHRRCLPARLTSMISLKSVALDQFAKFRLGVGTEASPTNRSASLGLEDDTDEVCIPRLAGKTGVVSFRGCVRLHIHSREVHGRPAPGTGPAIAKAR